MIPLKKGTFWKVTKDTIDIENEELFSCVRLTSKSQIYLFGLKRETPCTYQKEERLEQREIQKCIEAFILVIGDVSPTQNLQELN
jgi:hypothetical protein